MAQTGEFSIISRELGPMENFIYLLHDHASGRAAIVDPAWEVEQVIDIAKQQDIRITDILLTHSHNDHINGIEKVLQEFDAQVHLTKAESRFWGRDITNPVTHHGGDIINLGESEIEVMHTPGHTPGSACYKLANNLIAGDTMFVFGCGRCDLAGGDPEQMYHTLKKIKSEMPGDTVLHPGHNYSPAHPTSTLQQQNEGNPFLHFDSSDEFVKYRMQVHDKVRSDPYEAMSVGEVRRCMLKFSGQD